MCDRRLWFVLALVLVITGAFGWRLFELQIVEGGEWRAQAKGQQKVFTQAQGDRGEVYLHSNGEPITAATNKKVYHAYISPRRLANRDKEELASEISEALNAERENILERMERDSSYEVIKKDLSGEKLEKIGKMEEVHIQEEITRYYPEEELASHVLGFLGGENKGQYGVEQYYEEILSGEVGIREGLRNPWGSLITRDSVQRGEDIFLTLDYNIQHFAERKLAERIEKFDADGGMALVGDPQTGEIVAMVDYPGFDPNDYSDYNSGVFSNSLIQSAFEPGSVFKPLTMAAALNEDVVTPGDTFYDTGKVQIHGRTIYNYGRRSYNEVDMSKILENSINTGIVHVKDQLGNDRFLDYLYDLGFFESTGIDLHGEVSPPNRGFLMGHDINYATASYGQGIEATAIQLFKAFSSLANDGEMVQPHVTQREGEVPGGEKVFSEESAHLTTEMMVNTVEDGFGATAKVPGYHIAGKTGTAQVPWSALGINRSGYSDRTKQGFIGFAPAFDPEFLIFVNLDNPRSRSAEVSAAPLFKEIAEFMFEYEKIPPDYDKNETSE